MSYMQLSQKHKKQMRARLNAKIGIYVQDRIKYHINYEGRNSTNPYPRSIRAKLTNGTTLYDTGKMYDNIKWYPRNYGVVVGSTLKRALYHHKGYTIKPKKKKALAFTLAGKKIITKKTITVPKRVFYYLRIHEQNQMEQIIVEELGVSLDIQLKSIFAKHIVK